MLMIAHFNGFSISMTRAQAASAHHTGQCVNDVRALSRVPSIARQLAALDTDAVISELAGYGAWGSAELTDLDGNLQRILWIAAGNIIEENTP